MVTIRSKEIDKDGLASNHGIEVMNIGLREL